MREAQRSSCPECSAPDLARPRFTWWGGVIGAWLLNHTICRACGLGFNAKSGTSNARAIGLYLALVALVGALIVVTGN